MFPKVIRNPYHNGWSGPEFPMKDGVYIKVDKRTAIRLFVNDHFPIYISTSRGYMFSSFVYIEELSVDDNRLNFTNFLHEFYYYNCTAETGKNISYWFNIGDLNYSEINEICSVMNLIKNANYSTILKWYKRFGKKRD